MARHGLAACFLFVACLSAGAGETIAPAKLEVRGESGKAVVVSAKQWAKLPRSKVEVKGKGGKASAYDGVPLAEVLKLAGVSFAEHPRGRASAYVLVEGADGYRAVLALVEVDARVTDKVVLLADRLDGKPLPDGVGPRRLVVSGDKAPVRAVKQVVRVSVHRHRKGTDKK
jgi:DMSO/TMAO reductase YedYZ molybdopterin-dependent catalytic subunit